jgi:hypothetical protein
MLSLGVPGVSAAAPQVSAQPVSARITLLTPVAIVKLNDMDFGSLGVTARGTAVINPNSGALTTTGGVQRVAGNVQPASFRIVSNRTTLFIVHLPSAPATLTRIGGTETMSVSNWTIDGLVIRLVAAGTPADFHIGATLDVAAGQADGTYAGTFPVTADYF